MNTVCHDISSIIYVCCKPINHSLSLTCWRALQVQGRWSIESCVVPTSTTVQMSKLKPDRTPPSNGGGHIYIATPLAGGQQRTTTGSRRRTQAARFRHPRLMAVGAVEASNVLTPRQGKGWRGSRIVVVDEKPRSPEAKVWVWFSYLNSPSNFTM
jgi:hypothetical protein